MSEFRNTLVAGGVERLPDAGGHLSFTCRKGHLVRPSYPRGFTGESLGQPVGLHAGQDQSFQLGLPQNLPFPI